MDIDKIISSFKDKKIGVIGDLMVDEFISGVVERISPEAPVPIVAVNTEYFTPGGAANVANNLYNLTATVYPMGVVGADIAAKKLIEFFKNKNIEINGIIVDPTRPTTLKTRIIAHNQQMIRIDREKIDYIPDWIVRKLIDYIKLKIDMLDAVIISDYNKGVLSIALIEELLLLLKEKIIMVDPKFDNFWHYKNITCITPNLEEASRATHRKLLREEDVIISGKEIKNRLNSQMVLITRGKEGMTLFKEDDAIHIPTVAKEVYDVTGAGDTVIATFTLSWLVTKDAILSAKLANIAAGIVVEKVGTATVSCKELKERALVEIEKIEK